MIDREHDLPITRQAEVLRISRGSVYYLPRPVSRPACCALGIWQGRGRGSEAGDLRHAHSVLVALLLNIRRSNHH